MLNIEHTIVTASTTCAPAALNISNLAEWHKYELTHPELAERRAVSTTNEMNLTQAQLLQALLDNHTPDAQSVCDLRWFASPIMTTKPTMRDDNIFFTQFRGELTSMGANLYHEKIERINAQIRAARARK